MYHLPPTVRHCVSAAGINQIGGHVIQSSSLGGRQYRVRVFVAGATSRDSLALSELVLDNIIRRLARPRHKSSVNADTDLTGLRLLPRRAEIIAANWCTLDGVS